MCTLVLLRRPGHRWPVLLGANRDELAARPWRPPARHWPDRPEVVAGLDESAGGSWLGVNDHGVVAGVLNRAGSLGPLAGKRSRGELVLEALDHADAEAAARALADLDGRAYRTFNMAVADNRDAFRLRHAGADAAGRIEVEPLGAGLSMLTSLEVNDLRAPRIARHLPAFRDAAPPEPERGAAGWAAWTRLLADRTPHVPGDPNSAMNIETGLGFATVSSSLVALPGPEAPRGEDRPVWLFAAGPPDRAPYLPAPGLPAPGLPALS